MSGYKNIDGPYALIMKPDGTIDCAHCGTTLISQYTNTPGRGVYYCPGCGTDWYINLMGTVCS